MNRGRWIALLLLMTTACTVVKPVTCAVTHPIFSIVEIWDEAGEKDEDRHNELPTGVAVVEAVVLLPAFWVYKTAVGAVGGLFTGFVSDLNMIVGEASFDSSLDTILDPIHTNKER